MQNLLIKNYLQNKSLDGKALVDELCLELQQVAISNQLDKALVKAFFQNKYPEFDDETFELLYLVATLYIN